jgi:hypothetical protein
MKLKLNARTSMILVTAILAGFFVVSFSFLKSQGSTGALPSRPLPTPEPEGVQLPEAVATLGGKLVDAGGSSSAGAPAVEITNFQRSESKNGKLAWELAGSAARYELGGSRIDITNAKVATTLSNGVLATLTTDKAQIAMSGATLAKAEGLGRVTIVLDNGVSVRTESAAFERETGKVSSATPITILHPSGSLTSDSFKGDTINGKFLFSGNVHTTILPKEKR